MRSIKLLLVVVLAMAGVVSADMVADFGSAASGYPDTPGSIVDADGSYDTEFWTYNNLGSSESLTADSYVVTGPTPPGGYKNTYSRVYFDGTHDAATHHQVADLGFDIHDGTVAYNVNMRVKFNSVMAMDGDNVFTMYTNAGVGNGYKDGLHIWKVYGVDSTGQGGVADSLEIGMFSGNQARTAINFGQWYDVVMEVGAVDGARPIKLYLDGVEIDDFKWGSYWGLNSGEAYTTFGIGGSGISANYEVDYYSVTAVPEPATMLLLGIGGLLSVRKRK